MYKRQEESQLERLGRSIREVGLTITRVQFLNVIKTLPSNGNLLAAIIDDIDFDQVVGTIAGHDTIVVISPDEKQAKWFEEAYRHAFDR